MNNHRLRGQAITRARVAIGLAVYNGSNYLRQAIDSILAQTFTDFELIISDNASTDGTREICLEYAGRDARIRYHRNPANIGGANNENQTFTMSQSEYFRWAAHDDYLAPTLLEKCVAILDARPEVVLAYPHTVEIDSEGCATNVKVLRKGMATRPSDRFRELAFNDHHCEPTYGLVRADVMHKTRLQQNYTGSDRVLLCELALYGPFYEIAEPLFYKRYHQANAYVDWRSRISWFNPTWKGRISIPHWHQFFDFITTIQRVHLPSTERRRCYGTLAHWLALYGRRMIKDLIVAGYMLLHTHRWRERKAITNWEVQ